MPNWHLTILGHFQLSQLDPAGMAELEVWAKNVIKLAPQITIARGK